MTAHRLLYTSYPRKDGTFYHKPKRPLDQNYKLIVVDEISMLPKEMWDLLLSHHIYVIALGDPEQLPPISGDNNVLSHPHIFLDEIMRQAQESEIIRISMDVREGKPLQLYNGNEVKIIDKNKFETGMCLWADQIIVAKNDTRRNINSLMRRYLFEVDNEEPVVGDKLICLKNDWDNMNGIGDINVNGTIGYVKNISYNRHHQWLHPMLTLDFIPDYYNPVDIYNYGEDKLYFKDLNVDYKLLTTGEPTINKNNFNKFPKPFRPKEFDYGYCITAWKAQGSEYDKVLLFEENFPFDTEEHRKFLYTAITRAKEKIVIVRK